MITMKQVGDLCKLTKPMKSRYLFQRLLGEDSGFSFTASVKEKHLFMFLHLLLLFIFVREQAGNSSAACYWTVRCLQKLFPIFSFLASFRHGAESDVS